MRIFSPNSLLAQANHEVPVSRPVNFNREEACLLTLRCLEHGLLIPVLPSENIRISALLLSNLWKRVLAK